MIVQWLTAARNDIARIASHIAEENPRAATRIAQELLVAGDSLALFPNRDAAPSAWPPAPVNWLLYGRI